MVASIRVSFVVTVYNKAPYLAELFASLRDQLPAGQLEYLFVDDCSRDASVQVLHDLRAALPEEECECFRILSTGENSGPARATNVGWRAARGRYIHVVDGDDRLPAGATAALLGAAERHGAELVFGEHCVMSGSRRVLGGYEAVEVSDDPFSFIVRRRLVGVRFLADREAVARSGGSDEALFLMDCSLPWRIAATARRMALVRAPVVERRIAAEGRLSDNPVQELYDFLGAAIDVLSRNPTAPDAARRLRARGFFRLARHARALGRFANALACLIRGVAERLRLADPHASLAAMARGRVAIAASATVRDGPARRRS